MTTLVETPNLKLLALSKNPAMQKILKDISLFEGCEIGPNILISGETGTGKDLLAQAIFEQKSQSQAGDTVPFQEVRCNEMGGISDLDKACFFGGLAGEFEGAATITGHLEMAKNGILYMPFLNYLPGYIQDGFKDVLTNRKFQRMGSKEEIEFNAQIVSATSKNLKELSFSPGLQILLSDREIFLPPLRERREDIVQLAEHFLTEVAAERSKDPKTLSSSAKDRLMEHSWPGNIRELRNVARATYYFTEGTVIEADDLDMR